MKYPFKLSKVNIIYAAIVSILIIIFNVLVHGADAYTFGMCIASIFFTVFFSLLFALLFWYINGRKENGGTTTFNVVMTLMLLSALSQFVKDAEEKQKPIDNIKSSLSEYKKNIEKNPDSVNSGYSKLSGDIKTNIDELIETSHGEEKEVYLILKDYFNNANKINTEWLHSYDAIKEPRIFDFSLLSSKKECDYQISIINKYVDNSVYYKKFVLNSSIELTNKSKGLDQSHDAVVGFMKGFKEKNAAQLPIFIPYIDANIAYGQDLIKIITLLKTENGNWKLKNNTVEFKNKVSQIQYQNLLNDAIENEEIINKMFEKLNALM